MQFWCLSLCRASVCVFVFREAQEGSADLRGQCLFVFNLSFFQQRAGSSRMHWTRWGAAEVCCWVRMAFCEFCQVLELCEEEQTFQIPDVGEDCVLSFLRDFSAPIKVKFDQQSDSDIAFLMAHDSDDFAKWQAAHTVATKILRERAEVWSKSGGSAPHFKELPKTYVDAFRATLLEEGRDKSIQVGRQRREHPHRWSKEVGTFFAIHLSLDGRRRSDLSDCGRQE